MTEVFMSRQPLVNRQRRIIATRLTLHLESGGMPDAVNALGALASVWPQGEKPVFVSCGRTPCDASLLDWSAPENATIELPAAALLDQNGPDLIAALQTWQPTVCLHFDPQATQALSAGVVCRFIGFDAQHFALAQLKLLAARTRTYGMGIAFNIENTADFRACVDAGMTAAAGWFFTAPNSMPAKTLNPGQANIVRVLNLVRHNADIREIEAALKQDVAISYKLLRYINSAGFGLSCEIQSFRHAVSILGYDALNKWLSLLLVTASRDPSAPALMQTAIARGRFMEEIGGGFFDAVERDNLFITGAFSLLHTLLGTSIQTLLEEMNLPPRVSEALLYGQGDFAPFLHLAQCCESFDPKALQAAVDQLHLSCEQVNRAQLVGLGFADSLHG